MKIKQGFMLREVAGTYVVVAVGKASHDFNGVINLKGIAPFLWEKLQEDVSYDQLVDMVLNEYDVSKDIVSRDVESFLNKLKEANLLE